MKALFFLCMILVAAGCSKKQTNIDVIPDVQKVEVPAAAVDPEPEPVAEPVAEQPEINSVTVYFEFDKATLMPQEAMKLDALINSGKAYTIDGHACVFGTNEYNLGLGLDRARAVKIYIGRGTLNSYGEEMCRATCGSIDEAGCADCRKVEVKIK